MGGLSIWHWLIVLLVVVLVFGTKKLGNMGGDIGKAVKGFKDAMEDNKKKDQDQQQLPGNDKNDSNVKSENVDEKR